MADDHYAREDEDVDEEVDETVSPAKLDSLYLGSSKLRWYLTIELPIHQRCRPICDQYQQFDADPPLVERC